MGFNRKQGFSLAWECPVAAALEGTRLNILNILRSGGSVTVEELAQTIGLASATIRRHLDILQRDQLVTFDQVRRKSGRPEFAYRLTERGHETGYRDYPTLLNRLIRTIKGLDPAELTEQPGEQLLQLLMDRMSERLITSYTDTTYSLEESPVQQLERVLTDAGFSPQVSLEDGRLCIRLCNCPFRAAALEEESLCLFDRRLIANILGREPERQTTIRDGHDTCTYVATLKS
jgi:predicted ArsR family transcriptional regulator